MGDSKVTLDHFFRYRPESVSQDRLSQVNSTDKLIVMKKKIVEEAGEIRWPVAFGAVIEKVNDLLDIDTKDILIGAWKKREELSKYADTDKYPPGQTFLVSLFEHTVASKHEPYVEVLVNGKEVGRIKFGIDLELKLKGATLKIDGGKIVGVSTGTCEGKGAVRCEGVPILERETQPFTLPGNIHFDPGIPVPKM
jgi:hypothetical protein